VNSPADLMAEMKLRRQLKMKLPECERWARRLNPISGCVIYAATPKEIETCRKAFIRKWRLRHRAVADCLEEAGDRLFSFTRLGPNPAFGGGQLQAPWLIWP
jgi:hypothetical protein